MSKRGEAIRNGMVLQIYYGGERYEYIFQESTFTTNSTVLEQKLLILEELDESNLNHVLVIVREDGTEQVMDDESVMSIYHETFQESVHIEIRPVVLNRDADPESL